MLCKLKDDKCIRKSSLMALTLLYYDKELRLVFGFCQMKFWGLANPLMGIGYMYNYRLCRYYLLSTLR